MPTITITESQLETLTTVCARAKGNVPCHCDEKDLPVGRDAAAKELNAKISELRKERKKEHLGRLKKAASYLKKLGKKRGPYELDLPASSLNFLSDLCCWVPESDGLSAAAVEVATVICSVLRAK